MTNLDIIRITAISEDGEKISNIRFTITPDFPKEFLLEQLDAVKKKVENEYDKWQKMERPLFAHISQKEE